MVAGALHSDVVVRAPHLPRLDETLLGSAVDYRFGGKGGNQALAAARAGARVAFAGRIGADPAGAGMKDVLERAGVDLANLQCGSGPSGMSVAITDEGGGYGAVIVPAENHRLDTHALSIPPEARVMLLQNELDPKALKALIARGRTAGLSVILNAAPARGLDQDAVAAVDTLVVNRLEGLDLLRAAEGTPDDEIVAGLRAIAPMADIVLTLGADGAAFSGPDQPLAVEGAPAVTVRSTHGAGDVFCGTFAAARLGGQPLGDAVASAQRAAARHVAAERI